LAIFGDGVMGATSSCIIENQADWHVDGTKLILSWIAAPISSIFTNMKAKSHDTYSWYLAPHSILTFKSILLIVNPFTGSASVYECFKPVLSGWKQSLQFAFTRQFVSALSENCVCELRQLAVRLLLTRVSYSFPSKFSRVLGGAITDCTITLQGKRQLQVLGPVHRQTMKS